MPTHNRSILGLTLLALLVSLGVTAAAPIEPPEVLNSGWTCWPAPGAIGCNRHLNAVTVVPGDSTNVWAVGEAGTILHWNNAAARWDPVSSPTTHHLYGIAMTSASDGWAVGSGGTILHWNGTAWNAIASPTLYWLYGVAVVSGSDAWAVGEAGTIVHWNGSVWSQVSSPTATRTLMSIDMLSGSDGWAVGGGGIILRWDGSAWSWVSSPSPNDLQSVSLVTGTDGWAVGGSTILHWDGVAWDQVEERNYYFTSVAMLSSTDGWAVGTGYLGLHLLHWNGNSWTEVPLPSHFWALAVVVAASSDAWTVGRYGITHRWNGSAWNIVSEPFYPPPQSVDMASSTDGWAVGSNSFLHWDGSTWSQIASPTTSALYSIDMLSASDGWAVGYGGTTLHWNGGSWSLVSSPTSSDLYSIAMVTSTDGWTVGASGTILHWDGMTWTVVSSPISSNLMSVDMVSGSNGWAVGDAGVILHWDGTSWSQVPSPTTSGLRSIDMLSASDGWAVGVGGTIVHWNGGAWSMAASPTLMDLFDLAMVTTTEGWAVGFQGAILHWNGASWSHAITPDSSVDVLYSVAMLSTTEGWVTGINYDGSVILRYTAQPEALFALNPGWNMLALPLDTPTAFTAQSLLDDINGQGGSCSEVDRWLDGAWDAHLNGSPANNFAITLGEGYFTRCTTASTWTVEGQPPAGPIPVTLNAGWNLVSIHGESQNYLAQSLLDAIAAQDGECSEVNRWSDGAWDAHIDGYPFNNFVIEPDEGYYVRCSRSSSFVPQAAANPAASWQPVDATPDLPPAEHPIIEGVQVAAHQQDSLTITWDTDQPSQGWVEYGPTPAFGLVAYDDQGMRSVTRAHQVTLPWLRPGTIYYYRVHAGQSLAPAGNRPFEATTLP